MSPTMPSSDGQAEDHVVLAVAPFPLPPIPPVTSPEVDDKLLRRRQQYKVHQRRHRARQKEKTLQLERQVGALQQQVRHLQERAVMLESRVFSAPTLQHGAPMQRALEYFRIFQHSNFPDQWRFLLCAADEDVQGPDYRGVEFLAHQWRIYGRMFRLMEIRTTNVTVSPVGDMTKVEFDIEFRSCPHRHSVFNIYPGIEGNDELVERVLATPLNVPGKYSFLFDSSGVMTWIAADLDFVRSMQLTFGSLRDVAALMQDSTMSFCTGQIVAEDLENPGITIQADRRQAVGYMPST